MWRLSRLKDLIKKRDKEMKTLEPAFYIRTTYTMLDGGEKVYTQFTPFMSIEEAKASHEEYERSELSQSRDEDSDEVDDDRDWAEVRVDYVTQPPFLELSLTASYYGIYNRRENLMDKKSIFAMRHVVRNFALQEFVDEREAARMLKVTDEAHNVATTILRNKRKRMGL